MRESKLRVLFVAYPMLAVSASVAGGAEQMLWTLEREMYERGHDTTVAACGGSDIAGRLCATGIPPLEMDAYEKRECEHQERVIAEIRRAASAGEPYDLVHDKSGAFWRQARAVEVPVLATLHLPRHFYHADAFSSVPPNVFFNCVSESQLRAFAAVPHVLGAVQNGILLPEISRRDAGERGYMLWLGRICIEKGTHVAVEVAQRTGCALVLAGSIYRFSYHWQYFEEQVRPHIGGNVRFVGALSRAEKYELLRGARALLVTSLVEETSSLVSMEAMACGTPVLAFGRGALPEVVQHGVTGYIAHTPEEMVASLERVHLIDRAVCRKHVEERYAAARMADDYERLYDSVLNRAALTSVTAA